jgi:hypothetical protein
MGVFSILAMVIVCLYHRLVARPYQGSIAPIRFWSFVQLTMPPTGVGVGLAIIPVLLINALITLVVNGRILTYKTFLIGDKYCITTLEDGAQVPSAPEDC